MPSRSITHGAAEEYISEMGDGPSVIPRFGRLLGRVGRRLRNQRCGRTVGWGCFRRSGQHHLPGRRPVLDPQAPIIRLRDLRRRRRPQRCRDPRGALRRVLVRLTHPLTGRAGSRAALNAACRTPCGRVRWSRTRRWNPHPLDAGRDFPVPSAAIFSRGPWSNRFIHCHAMRERSTQVTIPESTTANAPH